MIAAYIKEGHTGTISCVRMDSWFRICIELRNIHSAWVFTADCKDALDAASEPSDLVGSFLFLNYISATNYQYSRMKHSFICKFYYVRMMDGTEQMRDLSNIPQSSEATTRKAVPNNTVVTYPRQESVV